MGFIAFLLAICAISLTSALQWEGAGATAFSVSPGWNPKPTAAPLGPYDLRRRQQKTISYDNICGYVSGAIGRLFPISLFSIIFLTNAANSVACANRLGTCSPVPSNSVLACCYSNPQTCVSLTHCIGYYDSLALCRVSGMCTSNILTLTWWVAPTAISRGTL